MSENTIGIPQSASAVVCELNPLHDGHRFVIQEAGSNADITVAVMSGNFTQRTEPALFDKYTRAAMALSAGADLVVELPFPWSCMGAEGYASAGVHIASCLGCTSMTFGSECGDRGILEKAADIKDSERFAEAQKLTEARFPETGSAGIFDTVMSELGLGCSLGRNDKLGTEYILAARKRGIGSCNIVKRDPGLMSASVIRELYLREGPASAERHIPAEARGIFEAAEPVDPGFFDGYLFLMCRLARDTEGILSHASKVARRSRDAREFAEGLPTKKYTLSRIKRELFFSFTGASGLEGDPLYTVLLGADGKGREFLAGKRKECRMPVITKPSDVSGLSEAARAQYGLLNISDEIYTLGMKKEAGHFMTRGPVII